MNTAQRVTMVRNRVLGINLFKEGGEGAALLALVRGPIERTWDAIAPDVLSAMWDAYDDEGISNEDAIEVTIDANHVKMHGGPDGAAADALISEACMLYGYAAVKDVLTKHIRLS